MHTEWLQGWRCSRRWLVPLALTAFTLEANAALEFVRDREPQQVFGGSQRAVAVVFRNTGDTEIDAPMRLRLVQTSSATAARRVDAPWKRLRVLPGQTVLESATLDFPTVRAETKFLVEWLSGSNEIAGATEVLVYPNDLLAELRRLAGDADGALGVYDPADELKPLLRVARVEFVDLGETQLENFRGRLAIVGPFTSGAQMQEGLPERIRQVSRHGAAVVWVQPPAARGGLEPSFYSLPEKEAAAVIVRAELVANLLNNPQAQINLVAFCRLALHPEPKRWPTVALRW